MAVLQLRGLKRRYGRIAAVDGIDLETGRGEFLAILGPSGSGKSTLMNILGGLDSPSDGSVQVGGEEIGRLSSTDLARFRAEKIGFVFQQFHLVPYLTALENVMLAQYFHSLAEESEAREALVRVGLGDRIHHLPSQLSGGEQQRVCVARALINQPNLILADEPTGNLDSMHGEVVMNLLGDLNKQGMTIVMVTHSQHDSSYCRRVVHLFDGQIINENLNRIN